MPQILINQISFQML